MTLGLTTAGEVDCRVEPGNDKEEIVMAGRRPGHPCWASAPIRCAAEAAGEAFRVDCEGAVSA
jgi:hypothetical protein